MTRNRIVRPRIRADCKNIPRPCPFINCRHHMLWAVIEKNLKYNHKYRHLIGDILSRFTDDQILEMIFTLPMSCVLDVADEGPHTLLEVARIIGVCHQRVQAMASGIATVPGFLAKLRRGIGEGKPYRKAVNSGVE